MNYVLIGDVHSQAQKLEAALSFISSNIKDARVVFLGDIFDSKNSYTDSISVYHLVREAEKNLNAIILQSNHQDKLIRYLKGNKVVISNGLDKTIQDFEDKVSKDELLDWLIRQSFGIVFRDKFGLEFRCAHAYFSNGIEVQDYDDYYLVKALRKDQKNQFLYGIQDTNRNRVEWWNHSYEHQSFVRASGHYRTVYLNLENKSLVLDSSCGDATGMLSIYDVNEREIHQF